MMDQVIQFEGTIYENGYGLLAQKVMRDKNLPKQSKLIYAYMCSFAGISKNGERTAFPSIKLQCAELGMSEDTYYKWRKYLIDYGYIKITKQRSDSAKFDRNIYSIVAIPKPVEDSENPYPNSSGTKKKPSNQGFPPYPNSSGTENSSAENSSTNSNSSSINSLKDLDTLDTKDTKADSQNIMFLSEKERLEQKEKYMQKAFYENTDVVPEQIANMLKVFSTTPEQAKKYYDIILIAKKNAEKDSGEAIWLDQEPELTQKVINAFSRAVRKIEKERNVRNEKGYIYKAIYDLITNEIAIRQRQYALNQNRNDNPLLYNWLDEETNE